MKSKKIEVKVVSRSNERPNINIFNKKEQTQAKESILILVYVYIK